MRIGLENREVVIRELQTHLAHPAKKTLEKQNTQAKKTLDIFCPVRESGMKSKKAVADHCAKAVPLAYKKKRKDGNDEEDKENGKKTI